MWQQNYTPLLDSVGVSALAAALPLFTLLLMLGVLRKPAWVSAVAGLAVASAAALCGVSFAGTQFLVSNYLGPQLTDILASLAAILSLVVLFRVWHPKDNF